VACSKFHSEDPQRSGASLQDLVAMANWRQEFVCC